MEQGEKPMEKLKMNSVAVGVVAISGMLAMGQAQAAVQGGANAMRTAAENGAIIEQAQFFLGGRNYGWYDDGWQGPGWYWCGYAHRVGFGWGGGVGWNNWRHEDIRVREFHDRDFHDRDFHDRDFHDRDFHDRDFHDRDRGRWDRD